MEKIGNMQIADNKENKFFCFSMISMACIGSGYEKRKHFGSSLKTGGQRKNLRDS